MQLIGLTKPIDSDGHAFAFPRLFGSALAAPQ